MGCAGLLDLVRGFDLAFALVVLFVILSFRIQAILNKHTEDEQEVHEAIKILCDCGSVEYARKFAQDLVEKAWKSVEAVLEDGKAKDSLKVFANYLIERTI